ncbi:MAG: thiol-disulfide oxidoreductase DCC family protein [Opitutaceae bacterium]|nr:thiol-disulfide oxidoreductase DCC family protein [Opitutaceae bacterium]
MEPIPPAVEPGDRVVLFDGHCVMCSAGARALMRADRRALFKLGTTQSPEGGRLLACHGLSAEAPDTFVLSEGSRLYVRSTAYVRILWRLGMPLKLLAAILWLVPRPVRDAGYNWVARNRFRLFGRQSTCPMPTPDNQAHFWMPSTVTGHST